MELYCQDQFLHQHLQELLRTKSHVVIYGLRIPEDVSLMGFDDMPTCELITPPLSTIRVPKVEMGEYAADILHRRILEEREGRFQNSDIPSVYQQISLSIKVKQRMSISVPRK